MAEFVDPTVNPALEPLPLPPRQLKPLALLPRLPLEEIVAIETVQLTAADVPWGTLRRFYQGLLGLTEVFPPAESWTLRFRSARVVLHRPSDESAQLLERQRTAAPPLPARLEAAEPAAPANTGVLLLALRRVDDAPPILREHGLSWDLLHGDMGLARTILLRDPAGNDVRLLETRAF